MTCYSIVFVIKTDNASCGKRINQLAVACLKNGIVDNAEVNGSHMFRCIYLDRV